MGRFSLLQRTVFIFFVIGILLYTILLLSKNTNFPYVNLTNALAFTTYSIILMFFSFQNKEKFPTHVLLLIVSLYSFVFTFSYQLLADLYTGFPHSFNTPDCYKYIFHAKVMKGMTWTNGIKYLGTTRLYDISDWGGVIMPTLIFKIDESYNLFNFVMICIGTVNAYLVYCIGQRIMQYKYAFIAALAYSIASYNMFFYGCFLKETMMVFWVLLSINSFYKYLDKRNTTFLVLAVLLSLFLVFYRPVVIAFLWMGYFSYFALNRSNDYRTWFLIFAFCAIFVAVFSEMSIEANKYTNNGDLDYLDEVKGITPFAKFTSAVGAFIGPFPTFVHIQKNLHYLSLFGGGLLFKFLLFFAHWKGFVYALRTRNAVVLVMFVITIIEMVALASISEGLEFRKSLPHVPLFILCAFWYMSEYDKDVDEEVLATPYYRTANWQFGVCCLIVFAASLVWNTLREKGNTSVSITQNIEHPIDIDSKPQQVIYYSSCEQVANLMVRG